MIPKDDPLTREERKVERLPARGIVPEKLTEGGAVDPHASEHEGGDDPVSASGIGAAEDDHTHPLTREVLLLPSQDGHDAILDDWPHNTAGAADEVAFIWPVPAGWTGFNTVNVVMIPDAEETITADIDVSVAAPGEAYNADTRQALDETKDIAAGDVDAITEWSLLDIGTLLGDIAVGDVIAIRFQSDTDTLRIIGLRINYGIGGASAGAAAGGGVSAHGDLSGVTSDQHHTEYLDSDAVAAVEAADPLTLAGDVSIAAGKTLAVDDIVEKTADAGVAIDDVRIKDDDLFLGKAQTSDDVMLRNVAGILQINKGDNSGFTAFSASGGMFTSYVEALLYRLTSANPADVEISSGLITPTHQFHNLQAQTGTTDDLTTLAFSTGRATVIYLIADAGDTITLKHDSVNLKIHGGEDLVLVGDRGDLAIGIYDPGTTKCHIIGAVHAEAHAPESHTGTDITAAELEDLSDGGETSIHSHAGGGASWISLDDTDPANFAGSGGYFVRVNATPDGLEFVDHAGAADPHTGYQKESEKAAANGYMGLDANQYGTDAPQSHVHGGAGSGGLLYSVHQYVFTPDAAPGDDVATGAHQGNIYVSGPSTETVKRITVICETAAGTTFTFTLDYDSGNDDFDSFTVDTEIDEVAVGTAKGVVVTGGFTTGTIVARSLISLDVTAVTGAPKDVTIILEVHRPLQT